MAHDTDLADRVRAALPVELTGVTEKRMFGGLAFLVHGHLAVAVSGQGGLMARCDRKDTAGLLGEPGVSPMVMRGRELTGWLRVDDAHLTDDATGDAALRRWVGLATTYAAGLVDPGPD